MSKMAGDYDWNTPPSATDAPPRLTVATCQIPVTCDLAQNVAHITDLVRRAAAAGADVAHFPECAISGMVRLLGRVGRALIGKRLMSASAQSRMLRILMVSGS